MSSFEEDLENRAWADDPEDDAEDLAPEADEVYDIPDTKPVKVKPKKRRRRRRKHPFLAFLLFVLLVVGIIVLLKSSLFAITKIEVEGNRYYTPSQIIELSGIESGKNLIFELKARDARDRLLSTPYIKVANVERVPLGTVRISVEERLEYAAISFEGQYVIIDKEGTVLRITDSAPEITVLEGIKVTEKTEGKPVKAEQTYLLTETLRLLSATDSMDLYFKKVYFSTAVVRAYIYDNYYCEGTPANIIENMPAIRQLVAEHYKQNITRGVIKVGKGNYLAFSPQID